MVKIVNFSMNPYLDQVCSWQGSTDDLKKAKASEILRIKITPGTETFSYVDDSNTCLAYLALHSNQKLRIGVVEFIRFSPSISKMEDHLLVIIDFIIEHFKQKKVDSFEIEVTHIPESIVAILRKRCIVESKILEKNLQLTEIA